MRKGYFSLEKNSLHISYEKARKFSPYIQVAAVWSDRTLSDREAWARFFEVLDYCPEKRFISSAKELDASVSEKGRGLILAVEGARLLCGDISRLDILYSAGVRFLTLVWEGEDIIGGAHGTESGLTPFGRECVSRCFELGIVPDVSHGSRKLCAEVIEMARASGKSIVATHSNSFFVNPHQRNLTEVEFSDIISVGGIVGISLAPQHLTENGVASLCDVVRHIMHYVSLGGVGSVALGCDFDGIDTTPAELSDISCLDRLYGALLSEGLSEDEADRIFFKNAYDFVRRTIK